MVFATGTKAPDSCNTKKTGDKVPMDRYVRGILTCPPTTTNRTSRELAKFVNHQENGGHEEEQNHRIIVHRLPTTSRVRSADQGAVPQ